MGRTVSTSVKKQLINVAVLLVLIAVTIVVLCLSNRELDFKSIGDFLGRADPRWLSASFGCMLGYILFEAISLHVVCRALGHKRSPARSLVYATADVYYSAITPSAAGGQPASAYYMVRDGMSAGSASFGLVFNLVGYTAAIVILGIAAFCVGAQTFASFDALVQALVILGAVIQTLLLAFFVACMLCHRAVRKCGDGVITLLRKIHIVKNEEKWRARWVGTVDKYKNGLAVLGRRPIPMLAVLLLNILQRASQILVACFVCFAVAPEVSVFDVFVLQTFVTLGYNSIPLPGGVGAFEFLYLHIFAVSFDKAFILAAMMVTRTMSYYISLVLSGIVTLSYHGAMLARKKKEAQAQTDENVSQEKQ